MREEKERENGKRGAKEEGVSEGSMERRREGRERDKGKRGGSNRRGGRERGSNLQPWVKFQVRVDIEDDLLHITRMSCFYVSISTDVLEKEWYGQLTTFLAS